MINFDQNQEQQFNELLNEAFENAQTFDEHKKQNKMKQRKVTHLKTRKQYECFVGDDFIINYTLELTEWAGDYYTPGAVDIQIIEAELIVDGKGTLKLPDGFIESFLESKLLNI
jgi:hypothetical protein